MLDVDDHSFDRRYLEICFSIFEGHPILGRCEGKRIAVRVTDLAFWIALCLYLKERGGAVLPLAPDTPVLAARRRAERAGCDYLLFGNGGEAALQTIERIVGAAESDPALQANCASGLLQMSSGTTGEPKVILRSWSSIDLEVAAYIERVGFAADATPVVACPVHHSYGLISGVLAALKRGVRPVIVSNPNPKYVLRRLGDLPRPLLYSSPTLIATVTMLAQDAPPAFAVMTSGTTMQKAWFDLVRARARHVHQQYGCSEVGCIALAEDIAEPSDLGVPLSHLEVVGGRNASEPSEIVVKAPGGALIDTRDLGYLEAGRLHYVARLDDVINVSGLKVFPGEVEEVVLEMPGVSDAVVYGQSQGFGTEQVCLDFVSPRDLPGEQIREWCAQKLAPYQVPMSITRVTDIPRQPSGKVSRKALAQGKRAVHGADDHHDGRTVEAFS